MGGLVQRYRLFPHQLRQFVVHDLNDLLGRVQALEDLRTGGLFPHGLHEILDDRKVNVGFQ